MNYARVHGSGVAHSPQNVGELVKTFAKPPELTSSAALAEQELQQIADTALEDTMEMMGFALGSKIEKRRGESGKESSLVRKKAVFENLLGSSDGDAPEWVSELASNLNSALQTSDPLAALREQGLGEGAIAILMGYALQDSGLSTKQRKKLSDGLSQLIEGENGEWILEMVLLQEMGSVPESALQEIRAFYRKTLDGSGGGQGEGEEEDSSPKSLLEWFQEIKAWPQRERRLKLIIQALGVELATTSGEAELDHLSNTIADLKRLVYFFTITEQTESLAKGLGLSSEQLLEEVLLCLGESWVYPELLEKRWSSLDLTSQKKPLFFSCFRQLLFKLPEPCFRGELEKETLFEAVESLTDQWGGS